MAAVRDKIVEGWALMAPPMSLARNSVTVVGKNILIYYQYIEQLYASHYLGWPSMQSNVRSIIVSWTKRPRRQKICTATGPTLPRQRSAACRVTVARCAVAWPERENANGRP
jgi:hypothetical protein